MGDGSGGNGERQEVVHRRVDRNVLIRRHSDREQRAGHSRQPAGPTLEAANPLLVPPVGTLVARGLSSIPVQPGEPARGGPDARIRKRGDECGQATFGEARLGVRQDDDLTSGSPENGALGGCLAATLLVEEADSPIGDGESLDEGGRTVRRATAF